jgi:AraC-like DNA-binding protein
MSQERRSAVLGPGDLTLLHSSRTSTSTADPSDAYQQGGVVMFDAGAVPIPPARLDQLLGIRLPADDGLVSLVLGHLCSLGSGSFHPDDTARLAAVTADLLTVLFARQLAYIETVPAPTRESALLAQIRSFALGRLGDPTLTPAALAAGHHISVRTLHRLFRSDNTTVAAWIRHHRLDACRRALLNPALADRTVQSIAARWGFTNASHFSRLFKATYGQTAAEYRTREAGTDPQ